ncbi:MAG: hypothetical protein ACJ72J_07680 [Nitrososphaeraceae archaeon]
MNSQSGNGAYNIQLTELGFVCSCADHEYRGVKCKHIHAIEFSFGLKKLVLNQWLPQMTKFSGEACEIEASLVS